MPIYEYYCDECGCVESVLRPVSECTYSYGCWNCGTPMARVFSPPALLGRKKPGSFNWEPQRLNGWDDRVATMRDMESKGPEAVRKFKKAIGPLYDMTLKYKKERYG